MTLSLDHTGKNITTQSTNENVYVKIPESSVLVPAILSEIALKVSIPSEDLVILDLKYIHVTDDKGQYACKVQYCDYGYYVSLPFPLQTWSIGKHLAGACMWQNEMNMMNFENNKKKNRLSLGRKWKVDLTEDDNDESSSHARIENGIHTVSTFYILSDST